MRCAPALGLLACAQIGLAAPPDRRRDLVRRPLGDLGAGVEHDDVVRHAHHQLHVVLDQDHRDAERGKLAQQLAEAAVSARRARRPARRAPARGAQRKRARDLDQPLVDVRQRARGRVERTAIADEGEQAFGERGARRVVLRARRTRRRRAGRGAARSARCRSPSGCSNSCVV